MTLNQTSKRILYRLILLPIAGSFVLASAQTDKNPPPASQTAGAQAGAAQGTPPPKVTTPDIKPPTALLLPGPSQAAIGAQPLTIEEAVAIALKTQPQVNIARANVLTSQGNVQIAGAGLLPQLSANAGYANQADIQKTAPVMNPFTAALTVQQLLFDFGRTRDQVREQSALERASQFNLTRTQQTVAMSVRSAFYTLVQDLANVEIDVADVATRQKDLDETNARMNNGLGAPGDVVQAKTSLAAGAVALASARDTMLKDRVALAQLLGIDPRTPIVPATAKETPLPNETDLAKLVTSAMTDRPDIKAAKEQVSAAGFDVSFAGKANAPRVDVVGGVNGNGQNSPFKTEAATYGISVTWLFGDGGLTAGDLKAARGNEEAARQTLISVTNQAVTDVSTAFVDLQSALQRLDLANVGVANAKEYVRIEEGSFMGGIGQFLDVTTAESAFLTAQMSLTQAQGDVERARVGLRTAIGLL